VPAKHSLFFERLGGLVHELRILLALCRVGEAGFAGNDEEHAPDGLVELDGPLQIVSLERSRSDVSSRGLETEFVEFLLQAGRVVLVLVVTGELHTLEAHLGYLLERGVEVLRAVTSYRVELDADRNPLLLAEHRRAPPKRSRRRPFDHLAPGHPLVRHAPASPHCTIYYDVADKANGILVHDRASRRALPMPARKTGGYFF